MTRGSNVRAVTVNAAPPTCRLLLSTLVVLVRCWLMLAPCAFPQEWLCLRPRAALRMRPLREPPWSTPMFRPSWSPPSAPTRCPSGPSWCLLEWSSWWGQRGFSEHTETPRVGQTALHVFELQSEKLPNLFYLISWNVLCYTYFQFFILHYSLLAQLIIQKTLQIIIKQLI